MKLELYNYLTAYGTVVETQFRLNNPHKYVKWTEENFDYVRYNPRKDVNRWGLSLTSLDGGTNGIPDLDSLYEYNIDHGTKYTERDFVTPTKAVLVCDVPKAPRHFSGESPPSEKPPRAT